MTTVIEILEQLETTAGRLDKEAILRRNNDNELLKSVFVAAGDPYTVYFVNKFRSPKPLQKQVADDDKTLTAFLTVLLPDLSNRVLTGNAAKEVIAGAFGLMDERQQKWCQRILLKNLRCGVQESTVNKVWPGAIVSFSVALAETLKSEFIKGEGIKILEQVKYPVRVEPKLDGLRCIAVKQNGVVTFYTRNGSVLETMPTIKAVLEAAAYDNVVLDGEGLASDSWNETASIMMAHKTHKDDSTMVYNIFDALPLDHWVSQETAMTYKTRTELVTHIIDACKSTVVKQVPHIMANNEHELKTYFAKCMDDHFEGVMVKSMSSPYKFKRSDAILKLKPTATWEGTIVGHYEGRRGTKREHMFGGFHVLLSNGEITRVGGGFNDTLRAQIQLENPDTWIGKIVEIEGQPDPMYSSGLTKDGRVRFPVYLRLRDQSDVDPNVMHAYESFMQVGQFARHLEIDE